MRVPLLRTARPDRRHHRLRQERRPQHRPRQPRRLPRRRPLGHRPQRRHGTAPLGVLPRPARHHRPPKRPQLARRRRRSPRRPRPRAEPRQHPRLGTHAQTHPRSSSSSTSTPNSPTPPPPPSSTPSRSPAADGPSPSTSRRNATPDAEVHGRRSAALTDERPHLPPRPRTPRRRPHPRQRHAGRRLARPHARRTRQVLPPRRRPQPTPPRPRLPRHRRQRPARQPPATPTSGRISTRFREPRSSERPTSHRDHRPRPKPRPRTALSMALAQAPDDGLTVPELMRPDRHAPHLDLRPTPGSRRRRPRPAGHPRALARLTRSSARTSVRSRASARISARTDDGRTSDREEVQRPANTAAEPRLTDVQVAAVRDHADRPPTSTPTPSMPSPSSSPSASTAATHAGPTDRTSRGDQQPPAGRGRPDTNDDHEPQASPAARRIRSTSRAGARPDRRLRRAAPPTTSTSRSPSRPRRQTARVRRLPARLDASSATFTDDASGATLDRPACKSTPGRTSRTIRPAPRLPRSTGSPAALRDLATLMDELDAAERARSGPPPSRSTPAPRPGACSCRCSASSPSSNARSSSTGSSTAWNARPPKANGPTAPAPTATSSTPHHSSPTPTEAPVVREIFTLYAHARLGTRGPSPPPQRAGSAHPHGKPWSGTHHRPHAGQPAYLGDSRFGDVTVADAHPASSTATPVAACQRDPRRPRRGLPTGGSNSDYHLTGLITCPDCGNKYIGTSAHGRTRTLPLLHLLLPHPLRHRTAARLPASTRPPPTPRPSRRSTSFYSDADTLIRDAIAQAGSTTARATRTARRGTRHRPDRHRRQGRRDDRYLAAFEAGTLDDAIAGERIKSLKQEIMALTSRRDEITDLIEDEPTMPEPDHPRQHPDRAATRHRRGHLRRAEGPDRTPDRGNQGHGRLPDRPGVPGAPWAHRFAHCLTWWGGRDSNPRPRDYESPALTR